jgi:membrane protein
MQALKQYTKVFTTKYWEAKRQAKPNNFFYKVIATFIFSIHSFFADNCFDKASTLTFYSLLAIIPMVAIGFGVAKELGFEERFKQEIQEQLKSQPVVAEKIIEFSNATLKQAQGELIAGLGVVVLLWTVFRMIGNIALYFNQIWKVKTPRTMWQQVKSFVPMILLFPAFLVALNSFIIYTSTSAIQASESIKFLDAVDPVITTLFQFLPILLNWILLIFLYMYLPNTTVSWKAGIIAGSITGILFQLWQWIYVTFQVNAASYGAIYGGFAAVPLFLIWLNYSWLIILFGTELAYHIQKLSEPNKPIKSISKK